MDLIGEKKNLMPLKNEKSHYSNFREIHEQIKRENLQAQQKEEINKVIKTMALIVFIPIILFILIVFNIGSRKD